MDETNLLKQQEELFERMMRERPGLYPHLIRDGVVNSEEFFKRKPRVVFLAKDPNYGEIAKGETRDLFDRIRKGGSEAEADLSKWTKRGILAKWLSAIHGDGLSWDELVRNSSDINWCLEKFKGFALVNIKKTAGKGTNPREQLGDYHTKLNTHAREAAVYLADQIRLYDPDIVVACGTGIGIIRNLFSKDTASENRTRRGWVFYQMSGEKFKLIPYYHFSSRVDGRMLHYGLVDAINEICDRNF